MDVRMNGYSNGISYNDPYGMKEKNGQSESGINQECQTCKNRKYVDGSDESDVSFKSPGHISPEASVAAVSQHEGQHVANAIAEGNEEGKELISSSVRIKMERCPECGKTYAAGGETTTVIKTTKPAYNPNSPYDKARKIQEASVLSGANVDDMI